MITIGIDPGRDAGIAVVRAGELVGAWDVRKLAMSDPWRRGQALQAALKAAGLDVTPGGRLASGRFRLAVEAQYGGKVGIRSALMVAGHAAVWEAVGYCVGGERVEVLPRVAPVSWQAMIGMATGPSKERKAGAKAEFLARWPKLEGVRQGAIDATWIALFADGRAEN